MLDHQRWALWTLDAKDGPLDASLAQDASQWLDYNGGVAGPPDGVMLFVVARTPQTLPSLADIHQVQSIEPRLQATRLHLLDHDVEEIDDEGYELMWFASAGESIRGRRVLTD